MKEYKTPVIEEVKGDNTIADVFESWGYCKAYVDRALAELSQYRLTGMTPGEIAEMRRDVSKMHGGWIPVDERLPEEGERCAYDDDEGTKYMKRLEIAYMTDTVEYIHGYYDGYKWMDKWYDIIENVIAWKIHEPYRPERSNDAKE